MFLKKSTNPEVRAFFATALLHNCKDNSLVDFVVFELWFSSIIKRTVIFFFLLIIHSNIPDNYKVLFLQGGGTGQFAAVPLNLMKGVKH